MTFQMLGLVAKFMQIRTLARGAATGHDAIAPAALNVIHYADSCAKELRRANHCGQQLQSIADSHCMRAAGGFASEDPAELAKAEEMLGRLPRRKCQQGVLLLEELWDGDC
jgi:hypothetical protein